MQALFTSSHHLRTLTTALAAGLVCSLLGASSALASLPAPNEYNTAPPCPVSTSQTVCGPWNVPEDPANSWGGSGFGQCTYWGREKRPDIFANRSSTDPNPNNWDGWTWTAHAQAEGLPVDGAGTGLPPNPQVGDIAVWGQQVSQGSGGHVAYVEAVNADGSIVVSEMNYAYAPPQGDTRLVAAVAGTTGAVSSVANASFIHQSTKPDSPPVASAPTVSDGHAATTAGKQVLVQLLGADATGAKLTYATVGTPAHGTLGVIDQNSGTVSYTPRPGYVGSDSFTYRASSSNGSSNLASVDISVTAATTSSHLMRASVSRIARRGRSVSVVVRVLAGQGGVTVTAASGRHHITLHAKRTGSRIIFAAKLAPGNWQLTVAYHAHRGFRAPHVVTRRLTIPNNAH